MIDFDTFAFTARYGLTSRLNVAASVPYLSIDSDKFQGAPYRRVNKGWGDLLLEAQYRFGTSPQLTLDAGLELPTGNIDETDELGQRICDILALGSGTTDPVIGASTWVPRFGLPHLDFFAQARYRFSGGQNHWGYRFGDLLTYTANASHPVRGTWRVGLRAEGFHADPDTWFDQVVPERGATMLYLGPTVSVRASKNAVVGAFARFPVVVQLEGAQMVAPMVVGLEFSHDLSEALRGWTRHGEEGGE